MASDSNPYCPMCMRYGGSMCFCGNQYQRPVTLDDQIGNARRRVAEARDAGAFGHARKAHFDALLERKRRGER